MNQLTISQKFKSSKNKLFLDLISGSTASLFMDYTSIMSSQFQIFSITNDIVYSGLSNKIIGFGNLNKSWDSYDADKISKVAIDVSIETLNHLYSKEILINGISVSVFPMRDGGIQFEFDGENICAELEINPNGDSTFILFDDDGNIIKQEQLFELSELSSLLEEAQYVV